jgi:NADH dehydrogenase
VLESGATGASETNQPPHVVIVGGGFGGLYAARALKDVPVRVTLIDRHNYHLFAPLLYQVATAALSPADIASPIRAIVRKQPNITVLLAGATGIDLAQRLVHLDSESLPYNCLILAAGASHAYFGHDEWERFAPGLKTLEDALSIRRRILSAFEAAEREPNRAKHAALLTFVVVGGGPTGVELAGALGELSRFTLARDFDHIDPTGATIYLLEAGPRLLPAFPEKLSNRAARDLERFGVIVRTGAMVTGIDADGVYLGEERIAAQTVFWAAGVAASPLTRTLGPEVALDRAGRVIVGPDLTIPNYPEVYVIGDLAAAKDRRGNPLPGTAPVALQQGRYAAASIARRLAGEADRPFRYRDRGNMATIGRNRAVADIKGIQLTGFVAWLAWAVVHIFNLIGYKNRLIVALHWLYAYITHQRGARLITGEREPPTPRH